MDKKQKILSVVALALIGGIAALSATGGVSNLRSSFWVDTGDGNGYWDYSDENTNSTESTQTYVTTPIDNTLAALSAKIYQLKADIEKVKKDIAGYKTEIDTLQKETPNLTKNLADADKTLKNAKGNLEKLTANLDFYVCTKKAAYKGKNYAYASVSAIDARLAEINKMISTKTTDKDSLPNYIKTLQAELSKIPTKQTVERKRVQAKITSAQAQLTAVTAERKAIMDSNSKCIAPLRSQGPHLETSINSAQGNFDTAQGALNKNTQAIADVTSTLTTAETVTLNDLEEDLEEAQEELDNNGGNGNNGGGDNGNNSNNGGDGNNLTEDLHLSCPISTEQWLRKYIISKVKTKLGEGVYGTYYYVIYWTKNSEAGPFNTLQEADSVALKTICWDVINVSDCYVEIFATLEARSNNSYRTLCDESWYWCESKCEKRMDSIQEKIDSCKSMLDWILRPQQDWDLIERDLALEFERCQDDCRQSEIACTPAVCGDGKTEDKKWEMCDDGNTTDGDGCSSTCQITPITIQ